MADRAQPRQPPPAAGSGAGASPDRRRRRSGGSGSAAGARAGGSRRAGAPGAQRGAGRGPASSSRRTGHSSTRDPTAADALAESLLVAPAEAPASPASPRVGAGVELARVVTANRRRAMSIAAAPAVLVFVVSVVVGAVSSALVVSVAVGAVLAVAGGAGLWATAPRLVLRALAARPVDEEAAPGPSTQVEGLCATMGLPVPALYLTDEEVPDAMAVGRGPQDGALVLTTGLLGALDPVALEGVLAHELAHLKRADTAPASVAAALALSLGLSSGAAAAVHALAGRGREFEADRHAVGVTRYPPGLRQALDRMWERSRAARQPAAGSLAGRRAGKVTRWLFTVPLPSGAVGGPGDEDPTGHLDLPSVRIAALDEW
jgi:Zn-dependent protease with chaperone function